MALRVWPSNYAQQKEGLSNTDKKLLRIAEANLTEGCFVIGIDPMHMNLDGMKMGMYISPSEGLITFSIKEEDVLSLDASHIFAYKTSVEVFEKKIYERLTDSQALIIKSDNKKVLNIPYKHVLLFPNVKHLQSDVSPEVRRELSGYVCYSFFRPMDNDCVSKISDLHIFANPRKPYSQFKIVSDIQQRAIFERLAPEYSVVLPEEESVKNQVDEATLPEEAMLIKGTEKEYRTFLLDPFQVNIVNDMGRGHRVILANPGAGKSVLLLARAFRYAGLYQNSNILVTCYNSNLADSYNFKKACAGFRNMNGVDNLYIYTFHGLVKRIYDECLGVKSNNIPTDEDIKNLLEFVKKGKIRLKFKAIFIDEVQIFEPLYLEICYLLLDKKDDSSFIMTGDVNQKVRLLSRKGDAPWKKILVDNGQPLNFAGRVRYLEKNYRNSRKISLFLKNMLTLMNKRFDMLGMITPEDLEYSQFKLGDKETTAIKIELGIDRSQFSLKFTECIKEIHEKYNVSYSDIAVLFPYRQHKSANKYYCMDWIKKALEQNNIEYSSIIAESNACEAGFEKYKTAYSSTSGVVLSTIDSSLGLDFKAVIVCGLNPFDFIIVNGNSGKMTKKKISSWTSIGKMSANEKDLVQSQMRKLYTACSRARDILYVISDMDVSSPMSEILNDSNPEAK